jgi:hypothetical protein
MLEKAEEMSKIGIGNLQECLEALIQTNGNSDKAASILMGYMTDMND